jgi:hypothetical protein
MIAATALATGELIHKLPELIEGKIIRQGD